MSENMADGRGMYPPAENREYRMYCTSTICGTVLQAPEASQVMVPVAPTSLKESAVIAFLTASHRSLALTLTSLTSAAFIASKIA